MGTNKSTRAALLLHPVRLRIVQAIAGREATAAELERMLGDVPRSTLYRHLGALTDGGMLAVVAERRIRGGVERTYRLNEGATVLGADDIKSLDRDDHLLGFTTFAATLIADFAAYLDASELDLEADGVGYRQVPIYVPDDEMAAFAAAVSAAVVPYLQPRSSAVRRRTLTTVLIPDPS